MSNEQHDGHGLVCRCCGCSDNHPCHPAPAKSCHWISLDPETGTELCSACIKKFLNEQ